jgi:hypothetical protein
MIDPSDSLPPAPPLSPAPAPLGSDLFALGRAAASAARAASGGRGLFTRSRQLLGSGAWRGPRDAADSYVEEDALVELGGLGAAVDAGVRTLVATSAGAIADARQAGLRCLLRLPYRAGEPEAAREARLAAVPAAAIDGVLPTPEGEPLGLDTLRFVAQCRLRLAVPHVVVDFARLGHRLAQMCLAFGADELFGPIVAERALRLGDNSGNPAATRREAATLIRGAGLEPHERTSGGLIPYEERLV